MLLGFFLLIGFLIGTVFDNIPYIQFDNKLGVSDLIDLCLAVALGFFVSAWRTASRQRKTFLIDELKEFRQVVRDIANSLREMDCEELNKSEIASEKNRIVAQFSRLGMRYYVLKAHFLKYEKATIKGYLDTLLEEQNTFWREVTDGELMSDNFKIGPSYLKKLQRAQARLESTINEGIYLVSEL